MEITHFAMLGFCYVCFFCIFVDFSEGNVCVIDLELRFNFCSFFELGFL